MNICPQCKSTEVRLLRKLGALETWQCSHCGHEATYHVSDPAVRPRELEAKEPVFRLMATWVVKPTATQLDRVRNLSPRLRKVPDSALLRNAIEGTQFELGRFNDSEVRAIDLETKLSELGMRLERVPVPSPPSGARKP